MSTSSHEIILAECMGLCGGVKHALALFAQIRREMPEEARLYVMHELVHNRYVTDGMRARNAVFIRQASELPAGATVLIGAHGLDIGDEQRLRLRAGRVIDATCPMVKRLQQAAAALSGEEQMVFFGTPGHPEVSGVISYNPHGVCHAIASAGEVASLPELPRPVLFCQTTLNAEESRQVFAALQARFPNARRVAPVCNASSERQAAVLALLPKVDALVVVGSANSSNANRLREIGAMHGVPSWLVDAAAQLPPQLRQCRRIGITAGASTPEEQIRAIINAIQGQE